MATTASVYNTSRMTRQVLKRHRKEGPSLVLHLYTNTFRFERQSGAFLCDSPIKNLLYFIRNQRVPADLIDVFDEARIPFFEGCLIVEVHDHRPPSDSNDSVLPPSQLSHLNGLAHPSTSQSDDEENTPSTSRPTNTSLHGLGGHYGYYGRIGMAARQGQGSAAHGIERPNVYRVVLYPSSDTLWADLKILEEVDGQGSWSDDDVLHVESKILALTSPPLCLAPDLQATKIANLMLSATALSSSYSPLPSAPHLPIVGQTSRKRGINSIEVELDKSNQRRRETILRLMERGSSLRAKDTGAAAAGLVNGGGSQASFSRIGFIEQWRASKAAEARNAARMAEDKVNGGVSGGSAGLGKDDAQSASGGARGQSAKKKKKKGGKMEEEPEPEKEPTPSPPPTKKKPAKKKAQREKEEREKAERERAEREAAAAKAKEEEAAAAAAAAKKKKKPTKKEKEAAAKKEAEAAAAAAAAAIAAAAAENAKKKRAPAKSKKAKGGNETSSAAASTPRSQPATTPQQKPLPTPKKQPQPSPRQANQQQQSQQQQQQQQQQAAQQALQQATMAMLSQQQQAQGQNAGFPMLGGVGGFGNGQFGAMNGATGMMMPGQNFQQQQQQQLQLQQQMAIQRALQQAGFQGQQMNGNGGGFGMNLQQLQALLAIQQQQQSLQQNMQPQQQQPSQGEQQELPIGVGMNNLPAKWGGNMN